MGLWDRITGKQLARVEGHAGQVCEVVFSPDGRALASASRDTTALVWDVFRLRRPPPGSGR